MHRLSWMLLALLLPATAQAQSRVVALGGTVTETLYAIGAGDQIVGVDSSSTWPPQARALPQVGYHRTIGAEGILSLKPTRVIATTQAGPPAALDRLRRAGVALEVLPAEPSVAAALALMQAVAQSVGKPEAGRALVEQVRRQLAEAAALPPVGRRVIALIGVQGQAPLVAGRDTNADLMIRLAGAMNAAQDFDGYRPLSAEALAGLAPDALLIPDHALAPAGGRTALLSLPGIAQTPAAQHEQLIVMDGLKLLGLGPRMGEAALELGQALRGTCQVVTAQ